MLSSIICKISNLRDSLIETGEISVTDYNLFLSGIHLDFSEIQRQILDNCETGDHDE